MVYDICIGDREKGTDLKYILDIKPAELARFNGLHIDVKEESRMIFRQKDG